jgi:hypothetical protein
VEQRGVERLEQHEKAVRPGRCGEQVARRREQTEALVRVRARVSARVRVRVRVRLTK